MVMYVLAIPFVDGCCDMSRWTWVDRGFLIHTHHFSYRARSESRYKLQRKRKGPGGVCIDKSLGEPWCSYVGPLW